MLLYIPFPHPKSSFPNNFKPAANFQNSTFTTFHITLPLMELDLSYSNSKSWVQPYATMFK